MSDGRYIFTMPENTPPLTYAMLQGVEKVGTTVTIGHGDVWDHTWAGSVCGVTFRLYDTVLAYIYPGHVEFTAHGDRHRATDAWLSKIVHDNGIGDSCAREKFVLCIVGGPDNGKPVEGAVFGSAPSCGYCGALLARIKGGWIAPRPFYRQGSFSSYALIPGDIRPATVHEQTVCGKSPREDHAHEPWCNHDAAAVRDGVCECGTRVSR
jgi:hypothetical protein